MTPQSSGGGLPASVPGPAVVCILCREAQICGSGRITRPVWDSFFVVATCPGQADQSLTVCNPSLGFSLLPCNVSSRLLRTTLYQILPWLSCHSRGTTAKSLSDLAPTSHPPRVPRLFPVLIVFKLLPPLTPHLQ